MSALGQKQIISPCPRDVRFILKADIGSCGVTFGVAVPAAVSRAPGTYTLVYWQMLQNVMAVTNATISILGNTNYLPVGK